jgi:hypothetical protein
MNYRAQSALVFALLWGALGQCQAQLPADFPQLSLQPATNPAPGQLIGSLTASDVPGVSNYFAILDNNLNPILLSQTNSLGNLACNGLFAAGPPPPPPSLTPPPPATEPTVYVLKDESFKVIASYQAGNG